jgi:hypothetical protein
VEEVEPAGKVVPVEPGVGVEEGLQQEAESVDLPERVVPVYLSFF